MITVVVVLVVGAGAAAIVVVGWTSALGDACRLSGLVRPPDFTFGVLVVAADATTGTFVFVAGTDDGVADGVGVTLLSRAEPEVCTSSNALVFSNGGDSGCATVLGVGVAAFDTGAVTAEAGAALGPGTSDSEVCADDAVDTGGAVVQDNNTGATGEGRGDSVGEGDGEGVIARASALDTDAAGDGTGDGPLFDVAAGTRDD